MIKTDADELSRARVLLTSALRRVPASVNNGNYNTAVAYKKLAATSHKLIAAKSPKLTALQSAYSALLQYT